MEDIDTSDLIMLIVDVFEQMLLSLYKAGKKVSFNGMKGNHDRFTEKKDFDPNREPALIVYKFLQRVLENTTIKINILKDKCNIIKNGNIKYLFIHGDGLSEKEIERRALAEIED
jgi:UDP-2,3-diacylglucosamine pyrophosphatase LpxH